MKFSTKGDISLEGRWEFEVLGCDMELQAKSLLRTEKGSEWCLIVALVSSTLAISEALSAL